jgi:hypothetical protein
MTLEWTSRENSVELMELSSIQLFQLRLSTSKAEKSNTSAKGCWEPL